MSFSPGDLVYLKPAKVGLFRMVVASTEIVRRNVTKHDGVRTWQEDADQPMVRVHWIKPCGSFETALVPPECLVKEAG